MHNKNRLIPIVMLGSTVVCCLIGVIIILVTTLRNNADSIIDDFYPETVQPAPVDTEPIEEQEEPTSAEEVVPDRTERLAYLGDFIDSIEVEDRQLAGTVNGLKDVFASATGKGEIASIEKLIDPYVEEVRLLTTELPKLYVGDKSWEFADEMGNPGQVVRTENVLYLFYYNDTIEEADPVIEAGFQATSYGYIQPAKDEYKSNRLIEDIGDQTETNRILSALVDGENLPISSSYYLVNQSSFSKLYYFPDDAEVSCYRINQDLSDKFIEVYLTADRYYTVSKTMSNYEDVLRDYLFKDNAEDYDLVTKAQQEDTVSKTEYTIDDFRKSKIDTYVWDGKDRELWESVIKTSSKDQTGNYVSGKVQQILQYALERHNITSCELIGETAFINGYPIVTQNVYAIQLSTGTSSTTDYYIGISEALGSATILPADAVPKE